MKSKCLTPCKGVYADVQKNINSMPLEDIADFKQILDNYKEYKNGFKNEKGYTKEVAGIFLEKKMDQFFLLLEFKRNIKLLWVKIYFGTATFDRITKDEKASNAAKLSAVGGAMGLLTGFSIISGMEILYFIGRIVCFLARIFVGLFRDLLNKIKQVWTRIKNKRIDDKNKVVSLAQ